MGPFCPAAYIRIKYPDAQSDADYTLQLGVNKTSSEPCDLCSPNADFDENDEYVYEDYTMDLLRGN